MNNAAYIRNVYLGYLATYTMSVTSKPRHSETEVGILFYCLDKISFILEQDVISSSV